MKKPFILIGGGGHAKVVADALRGRGLLLAAYVDPRAAGWLDEQNVARLSEKELESRLNDSPQLIIGYLGLDCEALTKRYRMMQDYQEEGAMFPAIIHPSAIVSDAAQLSAGVQVFPGAIINSYARIGAGAVVNSGAVVEHDAVIGPGAHVAPRAVVLGGAQVGECAYIGSGAVIIQNASVPAGNFVKALSVYKSGKASA